jgi:hypothetical protein
LEEHLIPRRGRRPRLEGWATNKVLVPTLRDASLRDAPQGEVFAVHERLFTKAS